MPAAWYTTAQLAAALGVTRATAWRLCRDGVIAAQQLESARHYSDERQRPRRQTWRIPRAEFERVTHAKLVHRRWHLR